MRDGVNLAIQFQAARLVFELVTEQAEQRDDPLLAGLGSGRRILFDGFELALKNPPIILGIGPGPDDLVLNLRPH